MKKIFYLLAALTVAFTACQKQPNLAPSTYVRGSSNPMNLTLDKSDYQLLPSSDYPYKALSFDNTTDANKYIPLILNARDPQLGDGSIANVTYSISAPYFKLTDSVYSDIAYTLTNADYLLLPGNTYKDFSLTQILAWLPYKYPDAVNDELKLLTFTYYNAGATSTATMSFLYVDGSWKAIYTLSQAQYNALGVGKYDQFTSAQDGNLAGYLNQLLKQDANLMANTHYGDIQYVSFGYYISSGTNKGAYQRVQPLEYNGTDWVVNANLTNTLAFLKSDGSWIPNPTVYYTLTSADTKLIGDPNGKDNQNIGTSGQRANLYKYGDFSGWAAADIQTAIILVLKTDFPNPKVNIDYKVTYLAYVNNADVPTEITFQYNGTEWVAK